MYIELAFDTTTYSFQVFDEAGVAIGSPDTFLLANYKIPELTSKDLPYLTVYPIDNQDGTFPFSAQYPRSRVIIRQLP